ncbi:MAG: hypothetical protein DI586_09485 [Micavibrio aeruginosavorus]|uniref:Iron-sulfur cluster carrier protein n=1 Tax=Micavibrio aeruginosavorus TaxID=349221 RepID=A0A2W5FEY4_9BACT|nr:MAG: hypothetical protein DI586_09485 [Micavibrio aeruginosavorus]
MFFKKIPDRHKIDAALQECNALPYVDGVEVTETGDVIVSLRADMSDPGKMESLRQIVETQISAIRHVNKAIIILTAERAAPADTSGKGKKLDLPHIKKIIAVASGKGGVGKSTVAANLAVALAMQGLRVGLMDADIYGPSVPRLMGVSGKPEMNDKRIVPFEKHGIKFMSMGFLVAEDAPMIWRGPMIQTAVTQLLRDVDWGELDMLVIDLPPGTGDAQLTLAQKVPVTGAVIVSTPQDLALIDARKAIEMFRKLDVPILGLVENMSYHACVNCGHEDHVFGHGGAKLEAEKQGIPFLGEIPLNGEVRRQSDEGIPVALNHTDLANVYHSAAQKLARS